MSFLSFQDFKEAKDIGGFIQKAISWYTSTEDYQIAKAAKLYDKQKNPSIFSFTRILFSKDGAPIKDPTSTIKPIPCNFFHTFTTFRAMYSLGNGINFKNPSTAKKLGKDFNKVMQKAGKMAIREKASYIYYSAEGCSAFDFTEFIPFFDEETGALSAGIRFWQIDPTKPIWAKLYEVDGYSLYEAEPDGTGFKIAEEKKPYKVKISKTKAEGEKVIGSDNYSALPIVPLYGNENKQSALVGMRPTIDGLDLLISGFADDVENCQQIYWVLSGAGGATDEDLAKLRENILYRKFAMLPNAEEGERLEAHTNPIPTEAHGRAIETLRTKLYEDFGMVDVHGISAGAKTATEIEAAYTPMDLEADDFEARVTECINQILELAGIDDEPSYTRNKIVNEVEYNSMIASIEPIIGRETALKKFTVVDDSEIEEILQKQDEEEAERFKLMAKESEEQTDEDNTNPDDMPDK